MVWRRIPGCVCASLNPPRSRGTSYFRLNLLSSNRAHGFTSRNGMDRMDVFSSPSRVANALKRRAFELRVAWAPAPIQRLARHIDAAIQLPTDEFLDIVDSARERFRKSAGHDIQLLLLGVKIINLLITKREYRHG